MGNQSATASSFSDGSEGRILFLKNSANRIGPTGTKRSSWPITLCLLLFAATLFAQRYHTYTEAFERDIAGYAVIAHEMLHGRDLYSDLWERKPPLLYATFAAAQLLCGYGPQEIFFLNITAATLTLIALYFVGKKLGSSRSAGLFAALLWVIVGGDMNTQANQPNAEVFVNACLAWAVVLLLHWPIQRKIAASLLLGALLAAATLYKQHVVVTCAAMLAAHFIGQRGRLRDAATAGTVIALTWISIALYFAAEHRFSFFFDTLFRQNVSYSGNILQNLLSAFLPRNLVPDFAPWVLAILPLLFAAGIYSWISRLGAFESSIQSLPYHVSPAHDATTRARRWYPIGISKNAALFSLCRSKKIAALGLGRQNTADVQEYLHHGPEAHATFRPQIPTVQARLLLLLAWAIGSAITFVLPGKFFGHYYQLWIPVWCAAGGWSLAVLARERRPGYRILNRAIIAGAFGCLLGLQATQYLASADEWTHRKYPVDDFLQERKMGLELAQLLPPGHTFYNLGEDTPLYFYSQRSPASGLLYLGPLETGNEVAQYQQRLFADLNRSKPDLIVTSTLRNTSLRRQKELLDWMAQNYTPIDTSLGCPIYRLYARSGSQLASRFQHPEKTVATVDLTR